MPHFKGTLSSERGAAPAFLLGLLLVVICACGITGLCRPAAVLAAEDAKTLVKRARLSAKKGDYGAAIKAFSAALRLLDPNDEWTHRVRLSRAKAYRRKKKLKEAWDDATS